MLEIGTGSGYQTAVLGKLAAEVYSIEIIPKLSERAKILLVQLGVSITSISRWATVSLVGRNRVPSTRLKLPRRRQKFPNPSGVSCAKADG